MISYTTATRKNVNHDLDNNNLILFLFLHEQ